MSLVSTWGSNDDCPSNIETAASTANLRLLDDEKIKKLFFQVLRAGEIDAIKNILNFSLSLLNDKLFGFEGADVYNMYPTSKTKRCYTYTGLEKDGFFYALHVAAQAGNKRLVLMLAKAGADTSIEDYRGKVAEELSNGEGNFLLIYICNFHVLSHLLLIYICKLHWNLNSMFVSQVNYL
jgi:hypothetical protein